MFEFDLDLPDDLFGLDGIDTDALLKEMLTAAGEIVQKEFQDVLHSEVDPDHSTGELANSISLYKPSAVRGGEAYVMNIAPKGNSKKIYYGGSTHSRKYALSNGGKLAMREYGTSRQPARPIISKVVQNCKSKAEEEMQRIFDEKVGGE